MYIVGHKPDATCRRGQMLQQPLHHRPAVQVRAADNGPNQHRPRHGRAQRVDYRDPKPLRLPLLTRRATHAASSASPRWTHDRCKTIFPLPAGADISVIRAGTRQPLRPVERESGRDPWSAERFPPTRPQSIYLGRISGHPHAFRETAK